MTGQRFTGPRLRLPSASPLTRLHWQHGTYRACCRASPGLNTLSRHYPGYRLPVPGRELTVPEPSRRARYSVMARMRAAISAAAGSGVIDWRAMSLAMSPSTLILPAMKACIPAWGFPSTRMALATS